jgi:uncharacterized membrane protein YhaH (DUF805 family)
MIDAVSPAIASPRRLGRARYWALTGFCIVLLYASSISVALTSNATNASPVNILAVGVAIVGVVVFFATCVALFEIGVRRLHDRGKSGFWIALYYPVFPPALFSLAFGENFGALGLLLLVIALAIMAWAIIDLGFLEGGPSDDPHGPASVGEAG